MELRSIKEIPNENKIAYYDSKLSCRKEVYGTYAPDTDITFILEDIIENDTDKCISTEVKGFYYGKTEMELIKEYINGQLKAEF